MSLPESDGLFHQNYFPPAIIAAVRAGLMGQLGFVAMRALGQRLRNQEIVGSPPVASRLGVSSFWIWHGPFRCQGSAVGHLTLHLTGTAGVSSLAACH